MNKPCYILAIESSCDETSAAVSNKGKILANVIAGQKVHEAYGGVVPELASRAHQQNIIPVVDQALKEANVAKNDLQAVAFTNGPGLMGSLLVGTSFAKSFALALGIPIIEVNHMQAHILALFASREDEGVEYPEFPFLCLTVSGGHTQIVKVHDHLEMEVLGQTLDDAAGEAFDKIAKILGLPYPGGPLIDKMAVKGDPARFKFPVTRLSGLNFSFSGLKTAVLYFIQKQLSIDPEFIDKNLADLCASVQHTIVESLVIKLIEAAESEGIEHIGIAGGVSANSGLRSRLQAEAKGRGWKLFIPPFEFCTDNAAMIAVTGYYKYLNKQFSTQDSAPFARFSGMK